MELRTRSIAAIVGLSLAGPLAGDLAAGDCRGCQGLTNHADSALASCFEPPLMNWQISVAYEIDDGSCNDQVDGASITCDPEPCSGTVTYAWGSEVAGGIKEVGYYQSRPSLQPRTTWGFGSRDPWKAGEPGSVSFGPEIDPTLECGRVWSFFIKADLCGPIEATAWASCTPCGLKLGG